MRWREANIRKRKYVGVATGNSEILD